jgi:hypothetical protein
MTEPDIAQGSDLTIDVGKAYIFVILIVLPLILVLAIFFIWLWGTEKYFTGLGHLTKLPSILPILILGIPFHELLHALGWSVFGRIPIKEVKFGVLWKALTPYAHLKNPIEASAYRAGTITPLLVMGLFPYVLGLLVGESWIVNFGLLFILAAGGDMLVIWTLRGVRRDALVIDHPSRVGCIVLDEQKLL